MRGGQVSLQWPGVSFTCCSSVQIPIVSVRHEMMTGQDRQVTKSVSNYDIIKCFRFMNLTFRISCTLRRPTAKTPPCFRSADLIRGIYSVVALLFPFSFLFVEHRLFRLIVSCSFYAVSTFSYHRLFYRTRGWDPSARSRFIRSSEATVSQYDST